jgi:hypothetical protein
MTDWSDEETDDPVYADRRNFYKVEKWSRDGLRVELMLYAGNSLDKARRIFERTTKHRPRVRLTIRQPRIAANTGAGAAACNLNPGIVQSAPTDRHGRVHSRLSVWRTPTWISCLETGKHRFGARADAANN